MQDRLIESISVLGGLALPSDLEHYREVRDALAKQLEQCARGAAMLQSAVEKRRDAVLLQAGA